MYSNPTNQRRKIWGWGQEKIVCVSIFNISFLGKPESADELSNSLTSNSDSTSTTKDSTATERIAYICGLRARIECER